MKFYKGSKKTGILLIAFLTLLTLSTEVFADKIKRSCEARYFAMITSFSYLQPGGRKMINVPYGEMMVKVNENYFKAQGSCGKLKKNQCRKRARDKLIECAWANARLPTNIMPPECRNMNYRWSEYKDTLISVVKEHVCARPLHYLRYDNNNYTPGWTDITTLFPTTYTANFILGVKTWGKEGCGSKNPGRFTTLDGDRYERKNGSYSRQLFTPLKKFTITCP